MFPIPLQFPTFYRSIRIGTQFNKKFLKWYIWGGHLASSPLLYALLLYGTVQNSINLSLTMHILYLQHEHHNHILNKLYKTNHFIPSWKIMVSIVPRSKTIGTEVTYTVLPCGCNSCEALEALVINVLTVVEPEEWDSRDWLSSMENWLSLDYINIQPIIFAFHCCRIKTYTTMTKRLTNDSNTVYKKHTRR